MNPRLFLFLPLLALAVTAALRGAETAATPAPVPDSELPRLTRDPVYTLKDLTEEPVVTYRLPAAYPGTLRMQRVEGSVVVAFTVTARGVVQDPHVISSTHESFEQAALDSVKRWKFKPGRKDGNAVAAKVEVSISFSLGR